MVFAVRAARGFEEFLFLLGGTTAFGFTTETDFLGKFLPLGSIARRYHWVVVLQSPFRAIVFWRHAIGSHQMPLEHLQFLAVFKTDNVVLCDRLLDRHGWHQLFGLDSCVNCQFVSARISPFSIVCSSLIGVSFFLILKGHPVFQPQQTWNKADWCGTMPRGTVLK